MERQKKTLLLIAENDVRAGDIRNLLAGDDVEIVGVSDLGAAARTMESRPIDGIVLDWVLPDAEGIEFIETVQSKSTLLRAAHRGLRQPCVVGGSGCRNSPLRPGRSGAVRANPSNACWTRRSCCCTGKKATSRRSSSAFWRTSASPTHAGRAQGAGDRRRPAQYFRAHQRSGASRAENPARRKRPRRNRAPEERARRRHRADGYHDAGDGRLSDHARDPGSSGVSNPAHRGPDRQGDEGRP